MKKSVYLSSLLVICCSLFSVIARAQAPVVTTDPTTHTVCAGTTTIFGIVATGATSYMWQRSTDGGTVWDTVHNNAIYSGATNDTVTIISNISLNGYMFRCIAFNTSGTDTSLGATLNIDTTLTPSIAGAMPVCVGATITLTGSIAGGTWSNLHHDIDTTTPTGDVTGWAYGTDTVRYMVANTCGSVTATTQIRVDTVMVHYPITGPTHVCVGNIITLANTNSIGVKIWSATNGNATLGASTSASVAVTGAAAGLDTIMYNITNACNSISEVKYITVETLPAAGTVTGTSVLCSGSWVHLTASATGGIWLSGAPSVAVVNTSGDVTGISLGTSIISYYQSNSCGASIASLTITVDIPASAISGNDSVGIDSTLMLSDATPGGTWSSADTTIAKFISAGLVKGIDTGVTTITYSVTNACGTSYSTLTMNVGPLPHVSVITGPDSVCVGGTITLADTVVGGTWFSKGDTTATINSSGMVTGVEYGIDTIYYTVTTAFGKSKMMKRIFVNQPPVITVTGPASVALGGGYELTGLPIGGTWAGNNNTMAVITSYGISSLPPYVSYANFVVLDTGTTRFTYTSTNTCGTRSKFIDVHLAGAIVGVNDVAGDTKFNVYPNPTKGAVTINIATATNEEVSVSLTDVAGRVVSEFKIMSNTPSDLVIDQPSGIYFVTATTPDGKKHTARISVTN